MGGIALKVQPKLLLCEKKAALPSHYIRHPHMHAIAALQLELLHAGQNLEVQWHISSAKGLEGQPDLLDGLALMRDHRQVLRSRHGLAGGCDMERH